MRCNPTIRWLSRGFCGLLLCGRLAAADVDPGVRVPEGFEVVQVAGDELAHDIYCLTVDSQGRPVVSGPGYIRTLIDADGDGVAERAEEFASGPKSGAMGLFFHGRNCLCVGDGGVLIYRDQDGDGKADGPPERLLRCRTGGEHDTHSIQHGPDGWWYIIAGNTAEITAAYATLPTSPIRQPRAGVLMRLKPDFSGGELIGDGFRNAYDFAFGPYGDIFTYDSDDERDISLPWYRPTRVFQTLTAADHGWISKSWKRPDEYMDMPPVVASMGRGSPTGMACYEHSQFPEQYHGGLFVLDWTYGRVNFLRLQREGAAYTSKVELFMSGAGGNGFAPTDVEVAPDGSLLVCVGGRGTRGGVYRVKARTTAKPAEIEAPLEACLRAPQPLSAWSRAKWLPTARDLGRDKLLAAAQDGERPVRERTRAIEIVTEVFGGLTAEELKAFRTDNRFLVRARAVWSHGRRPAAEWDLSEIAAFVADEDPLVARCALEVLAGLPTIDDAAPLMDSLAKQLGSDDRFTRWQAALVVRRLPESALKDLSAAAGKQGSRAVTTYAAGWLDRMPDLMTRARSTVPTLATALVQGNYSADIRLDAVRLLQNSLGDMGPRDGVPPAFDGYNGAVDPQQEEPLLQPLLIALSEAYPTGNAQLDDELARLLAMLHPYNQTLLEKVLAPINADSDAVHDIHQLLVAAQFPVPRSATQRQRIAAGLVGLDVKFAKHKLPQDTNWNDRIKELYTRLASRDEDYLATAVLDEPEFGRPGHVLFLSEIPGDLLPGAIDAFVKNIEKHGEDYPWNNDVVFLLGESKEPAHRTLIREQFERFNVRGAVLMTLAGEPDPRDRPLFLQGLEMSQVEVVEACAQALLKLPAGQSAAEQFALLRAFRRLGQDAREYAVREQVLRLLERNNGVAFPFVSGEVGYQPQPVATQKWTDWLQQKWPQEAAGQLGGNETDLALLKQILAHASNSTGDVGRGEKLYQTRQCAQCHGGRSGLGPDLAGAAGRFSKNDLWTAIVLPSRDVSARYQTTILQTHGGKTYSGLIVYESVDGLLLRDGQNQTFRIETSDVAIRRKSPVSLMPSGLLKDLSLQDCTDLYAYLQTLSKPAVAEKPRPSPSE